ncbi:MAG: hypothetical protein ACFB4J_10045 [Elainellaceae cyanobacterium]
MMSQNALQIALRTSVLLSLVLSLPVREAIGQPSLEEWDSWDNIFSSDPPVPAQEGGDRGPAAIDDEENAPGHIADGGSRGNSPASAVGDLCLMAPLTSTENIEVTQVWTDRPTLVWDGAVERVELQRYESGEPIPWQATEAQGYVTYDGDFLLLSGQIYAWLVYTVDADQPVKVPFVTLTAAQQLKIRQDLYQLEAEGDSPEDRAKRRADYFAERGLWSDFWAEVLSVENPSPEMASLIAEAPEQLCP